jgi:hypothetical protein
MPHQFFLHGQFNFVGGGEGKYTHAPPSPGGGGAPPPPPPPAPGGGGGGQGWYAH